MDDRLIIYKLLDAYASEIFGFLTVFMSQTEEYVVIISSSSLPVILDQSEILSNFVNQLWRVGLQNDIMRETGQLSQ